MDRGAGPQEPSEGEALREPPVLHQLGSAPQPPLLPVAGGAALVAVLIWFLQRLRRRRQPTPSERLAEATRTLGAASVGLAGRTAGHVSETAVPAAERAGEKVHKMWRKWTGRLVMLLAGSTGYVLGAAAGRERYDQIVAVANRVVQGQSHDSADTWVTDA